MSRGLRSNRDNSLVQGINLQLERDLRLSRRTNRQIDRELEAFGEQFTNPFHIVRDTNQPPQNPPITPQNTQHPQNHNNIMAQTLKQLTAPDLTQQPLCITYDSPGNGDVSLKSDFIHHLPHFEGTSGENPNQFLTEFHIECSTMKQGNATCPYHGFQEHALILFFVRGLGKEDSMMLTSACGGNIQNKTIAVV